MSSHHRNSEHLGRWQVTIYTLLQLLVSILQRNFSEPIFAGDPESLTLTPVHVPRALAKWNTLQSSSIYTLSKKKRNFPYCVYFEEECTTENIHIIHLVYSDMLSAFILRDDIISTISINWIFIVIHGDNKMRWRNINEPCHVKTGLRTCQNRVR